MTVERAGMTVRACALICSCVSPGVQGGSKNVELPTDLVNQLSLWQQRTWGQTEASGPASLPCLCNCLRFLLLLLCRGADPDVS